MISNKIHNDSIIFDENNDKIYYLFRRNIFLNKKKIPVAFNKGISCGIIGYRRRK